MQTGALPVGEPLRRQVTQLTLPTPKRQDVRHTPPRPPPTSGARQVGALATSSRPTAVAAGAPVLCTGALPRATQAAQVGAAKPAETPAQREERLRKAREYKARTKAALSETERQERWGPTHNNLQYLQLMRDFANLGERGPI